MLLFQRPPIQHFFQLKNYLAASKVKISFMCFDNQSFITPTTKNTKIKSSWSCVQLVDCHTQLTLIFMILHLYLSVCFMTNIKVTNMKNTAGKSARQVAACVYFNECYSRTPTKIPPEESGIHQII